MTTTTNTTKTTQTLIDLWTKVLGTPTPSDQQFLIWVESHDLKIVRQAILKTAMKNQSMNGSMCQDHRIRFACKVMLTASALRQENAEKHERVRQEFEGQVQR